MKIKKRSVLLGIVIYIINREILWKIYSYGERKLELGIEQGVSDFKKVCIWALVVFSIIALDVLSVYIFKIIMKWDKERGHKD